MLYAMKNKNQRELEKYWAEQAAKKAKAAKKKSGGQSDKSDANKDSASVSSSSE
jgi:hypothetical protein